MTTQYNTTIQYDNTIRQYNRTIQYNNYYNLSLDLLKAFVKSAKEASRLPAPPCPPQNDICRRLWLCERSEARAEASKATGVDPLSQLAEALQLK